MSDDDALETSAGVFSRSQERAILKVAQACASLSLVGSVIIVVARLRFKQLVAWLAVCDIFVNVSLFLGSPSDGSFLCYVQAILQQFFQVALIQWTLLISQSLLAVASKTSAFNGERRMRWNHLWAWGISLALIIGPMGTASFGQQTDCNFCWIKSNDTFASWNTGSIWRGIFLAIVFVSMMVIIWTYGTIINRLGRAQQSISLLSSHASGGGKHRAMQHSMYRTQGNLANERDQHRLGNILSIPNSAKPRIPLRPSLTYRAPSGQQLSQYRQRALQPERGQDVQTSVNGEKASSSRVTPLRGSVLKNMLSRASISDRDLDIDKEKPVLKQIARQPSASTASPPAPRRSSILKRLTSRGSNDDQDSGQGAWEARRASASGGPLPRRNSMLKRMISGNAFDEHGVPRVNEDASHRSSLFSFSMDNSSRRSSLFSFYDTNSQVRSKEWLWSTSRDAGFVGEEGGPGSNEKEDDKAVLLWVNLSASRSSSGPMEKMPPSMPLPTLMEADKRRAASSTFAPIADRSSNVTAPLRVYEGLSKDEVGSDGSRTGSSRCASTTALREGEKTSISGWSSSDGSTSKKSGTVSFAAIPGPAECNANQQGPQPTRSVKPRLVTGTGKARKFIDRMSSFDMDKVNSSPGKRGLVAMVRLSKEGRGKAESGDMEKFIARVKWYPVIFVLCWLFPLIRGIYTLASGTENSSFVLALLAVGTSRLQGLLNFIWYGLNDSLKEAWLQDFLYRRAVASCYRALLCCCSCSWCSKLDDGENGAVNDEYQIDHVDPGTRAPVTVAETINDIEDQLEGSAGKRTMIVSPSPPSQSPRASDLLGPPSTPVADFFTQISTPRRPSRPGRKSCVGKHKESKTDKEPKTTHLSRRSYKSDRRKKVKSSSCKVSTGRRKTLPPPKRKGAAAAPISSDAVGNAQHGGVSKPAAAVTIKHERLPLNPTLPISISMPVVNPLSAGTSSPDSTLGVPRQGNSETPREGLGVSHRWKPEKRASLVAKTNSQDENGDSFSIMEPDLQPGRATGREASATEAMAVEGKIEDDDFGHHSIEEEG